MKKGFTLIELLLVIFLLGIICSSSAIAFKNISEGSKKNDYIKIVDEFKESAIVYVEKDEVLRKKIYNNKLPYYDVSLLNLNKYGLIEEGRIDPRTGKVFDYSSYVRVFYDDGLKATFFVK